ncbi:hypothetical protein JCM17960_13090 [Magnetospira thiophila]
MKFYSVHPAPDGAPPLLIQEGFNWAAGLLGFVWALNHRLWGTALILFALTMGLGILGHWPGIAERIQGPLGIAFFLAVGYTANDLRRCALARHGQPTTAVVAAADEEAALLRVLNEQDKRPEA